MSSTRRYVRATVAVLCIIAVVATLAMVVRAPPEADLKRLSKSKLTLLPEIALSPFENTSLDATWVGTASCAKCHPDTYESYSRTAHSHAMNDVNPDQEPPDATFVDEFSGRSYRVYREDGELRHRESLLADDGEEIAFSDFPMRYVIGSGRFSKSYLVEADGFLLESPVTWYTAGKGWDISPGYDVFNPGFERSSQIRCIRCHVGQAETVDASPHRVRIHSRAIDCESCHGAGSLHVERRQQRNEDFAGIDHTIVHPGHLSRERNEAICAQCHLHSAATVDVRGRGLAKFRPGRRLTDFCVHYAAKKRGKQMEVVGHVEQMRLSRCYEASNTLTCTTCHDPHGKPTAETSLSFYRSKCLECHTKDSCGIKEPQRQLENKDDDCVSCHMPTSPTEIPHFAFTHHRIGIHKEAQSGENTLGVSELVVIGDISHLPQVEQDRCLGLAYAQAMDDLRDAASFHFYAEHALALLTDVRRKGLRDADVDAALAKLYWQADPGRTIAMSQAALRYDNPSPDARMSAMFTLGSTLFQLGRIEAAIPVLEDLVRLNRYSIAWFVLSQCHARTGDLSRALDSGRKAVEISPQNADFHRHLSDLYRANGNEEEANRHSTLAATLSAAALR